MKTSELYDLLHEMFGIGDYDEGHALFWNQARGIEIGKLNRMLKARHCTAEEVAEAARYAKARRKPITQTWQVFNLVPEAIKARRMTAMEERTNELREARSEAVQQAIALNDTAWADRLMRIPDAGLTTALSEWRRHVES